MNDFDKIKWGFFISALGIVFGWSLNQLGQWFRTRQEDKKNLKVVLFNLLETYFIVFRSDANEKLIIKVQEKVYSEIPKEGQTEETKKIIKTIIFEIEKNYYKPDLLKEIKIVHENYKNSINTLASIDPLTAYYLNEKTNIIQTFDSIEKMIKNVNDIITNEYDEIQHGANQALSLIKPDILKDTLEELENDIKKIAWKINPYVWYKSKKAIEHLLFYTNENMDNEIDIIINKVKPLFQGQNHYK